MGLNAAWIAVKGVGKAEAFERLGLIDTGEPADEGDWALSYAELPTGWLLILRPEPGYLDEKAMGPLSTGGEAILFVLSETVMYSMVQGYADGEGLWSIEHDGGGKGVLHLDVAGSPPPELRAVRDRLMALQAEEGGEEADVDHVFGVPAELISALCGFRVDDADLPEMTLLDEVVSPRASGGLFKSLVGIFKRR